MFPNVVDWLRSATSTNITCSQLISVLCPPLRPIARSETLALKPPWRALCGAKRHEAGAKSNRESNMEISNEIIFLPVLRQGCKLRGAAPSAAAVCRQVTL